MKKKYSTVGRYKSAGNPFPEITLTGKVYLKYEDDEAIARAGKGDVMLYLHDDSQALPEERGNYFSLGRAGYFKASVHNGREWLPFTAQDAFTAREHQFGKGELPCDAYEICAGILRGKAGASLIRTYREHYTFKE